MDRKGKPVRRIAVIGGGITGLAAAHRLREIAAAGGAPLAVTLLEASDRVGGVIATRRRDGFLLEAGPDSFITDRPAVPRLADRLGLADRMIPTRKEFARSFIVRRRRLYPTPEGFYLIAPSRLLPFLTTPLLSPLGKLRAGLDLLIPRRRSEEDESLGGFVRRRLGQEALDRLAAPMIGAIYGGDPMELSLLATFPRFREMERRYGSLIRAMWSAGRAGAATDRHAAEASGPRYSLFMSFDFGLQVLSDRLRERLPDGAVRTGSRVEELRPAPEGGWTVRVNGTAERYAAVIVALPGPAAAPLAGSFDPQLAERISAVPYGPSTTVSIAYRAEDVRHPMDGIGFVIPRQEGLSVLGCTFCHRKYEGRVPDGHVLLRAFHGSHLPGRSDEEVVARTREELGPMLGLRGEPVLTEVSRYPGSLPHYPVGHRDIVIGIRERAATHPGLRLAGNAYGGVGVPDCIRSGEEAAEAAARHLAAL